MCLQHPWWQKDVIVILNLVTAIYNKSSLQHACWKSCSKIDQDRLFGQQKDCSSVSLVIIANNSTVLQQIIALNPRALPLLVLCWAPCHLHSFKIGYLCWITITHSMPTSIGVGYQRMALIKQGTLLASIWSVMTLDVTNVDRNHSLVPTLV